MSLQSISYVSLISLVTLLTASKGLAQQTPIVKCESVEVSGINFANTAKQEMSFEIVRVGYQYQLRYSGPSYSISTEVVDGFDIVLNSIDEFTSDSLHETSLTFDCRETVIGAICEIQSTTPNVAVNFDLQVLGSNAVLSYQDGKPINLQAYFTCN